MSIFKNLKINKLNFYDKLEINLRRFKDNLMIVYEIELQVFPVPRVIITAESVFIAIS